MHYASLILSILPVLALAAPSTTLPSKRQTVTANDVFNAALAWDQDTGVVSSFLDAAAFLSAGDLLVQAQIALSTEIDELSHKAILDAVLVTGANPDPAVVAASQVLVQQGTFQNVLNLLQDIAITGNLDDIALINSMRCAYVLPAIDVYFTAVAQLLGQPDQFVAVRPLACTVGL